MWCATLKVGSKDYAFVTAGFVLLFIGDEDFVRGSVAIGERFGPSMSLMTSFVKVSASKSTSPFQLPVLFAR